MSLGSLQEMGYTELDNILPTGMRVRRGDLIFWEHASKDQFDTILPAK
jgi:hypothetical protein